MAKKAKFEFTEEMDAIAKAPLGDVDQMADDIGGGEFVEPGEAGAEDIGDVIDDADDDDGVVSLENDVDEEEVGDVIEEDDADIEDEEPAPASVSGKRTGKEEPADTSSDEDDWIEEAKEIGLSEDEARSLGNRDAFDAFFRLQSRRMGVAAPSKAPPAPAAPAAPAAETPKVEEKKEDDLVAQLDSLNLDEYTDDVKEVVSPLIGVIKGLNEQFQSTKTELDALKNAPTAAQAADQAAIVERFHAGADQANPDLFGVADGDAGNLTKNQSDARNQLAAMMDSIQDNFTNAGQKVPSDRTLMKMAMNAAFADEIKATSSAKRADKLKTQSRKRQTSGGKATRKPRSRAIDSRKLTGSNSHSDLAEIFENMSEG